MTGDGDIKTETAATRHRRWREIFVINEDSGVSRSFFMSYQLSLSLLLLALGLSLTTVPAAAEEETGPLFVKVFAGMSLNSRRDFNKVVRKNLKTKKQIEDVTVIPCDVGDYYGLGVIVSAPGKQFLSFQSTVIWRDLENYDVPRRSSREHTLRKNEYGTRRFFFEIRANAVDHDMTMILHINEQVFLRHKFEIRGCPKSAESSAQP